MVYFSCVVANRRDAWLIGENGRGSGDRWQMTWANIVTLDGGVWLKGKSRVNISVESRERGNRSDVTMRGRGNGYVPYFDPGFEWPALVVVTGSSSETVSVAFVVGIACRFLKEMQCWSGKDVKVKEIVS
ncbi:hypothetical protein RRG08_048665 [Elysia crispata]|uniref:Uncharacterized protein n=1 Tax=Elysia crispata TaxID=231223 RepID=A0AAE1AEE8_9GAST|nr:hypothetical protein RRG08_048665 [Elysia crispata]